MLLYIDDDINPWRRIVFLDGYDHGTKGTESWQRKFASMLEAEDPTIPIAATAWMSDKNNNSNVNHNAWLHDAESNALRVGVLVTYLDADEWAVSSATAYAAAHQPDWTDAQRLEYARSLREHELERHFARVGFLFGRYESSNLVMGMHPSKWWDAKWAFTCHPFYSGFEAMVAATIDLWEQAMAKTTECNIVQAYGDNLIAR